MVVQGVHKVLHTLKTFISQKPHRERERVYCFFFFSFFYRVRFKLWVRFKLGLPAIYEYGLGLS